MLNKQNAQLTAYPFKVIIYFECNKGTCDYVLVKVQCGNKINKQSN